MPALDAALRNCSDRARRFPAPLLFRRDSVEAKLGRNRAARAPEHISTIVIASQRVRAERGPMTGSAKQIQTASPETVWIASPLALLAVTPISSRRDDDIE